MAAVPKSTDRSRSDPEFVYCQECDEPVSAKGLCVSHYGKAWRKANQAKVTAYNQAWYQAHREEAIAKTLAYARAHPEKFATWGSRWAKANREKHNARKARRDARVRAADGNGFTQKDWEDRKAQFDNQCVYCGRDDVTMEIEHLIPIHRGGSNRIENVAPACRSCNARKATRTVEEYLRETDPELQYCHPGLRTRGTADGVLAGH